MEVTTIKNNFNILNFSTIKNNGLGDITNNCKIFSSKLYPIVINFPTSTKYIFLGLKFKKFIKIKIINHY